MVASFVNVLIRIFNDFSMETLSWNFYVHALKFSSASYGVDLFLLYWVHLLQKRSLQQKLAGVLLVQNPQKGLHLLLASKIWIPCRILEHNPVAAANKLVLVQFVWRLVYCLEYLLKFLLYVMES